MKRTLKIPTILDRARDQLAELYYELCRARRTGQLGSDIRNALSDVEAAIERVDDHPAALGAEQSSLFDQIDNRARDLTHEAYVSVIALGQALRRSTIGLDPCARDLCSAAVKILLDALGPYVSRADHALRRVLLDDVPLEEALPWPVA